MNGNLDQDAPSMFGCNPLQVTKIGVFRYCLKSLLIARDKEEDFAFILLAA